MSDHTQPDTPAEDPVEQISRSRALLARVPTTLAEWDALRQGRVFRTLNDAMEDCVRALLHDPEFRRLLDATSAPETKEGSVYSDDHEAARMIRDHATTNSIEDIANSKIATLIRALRVVLRRYHMGRNERANMIGGEYAD